MPKVIDRIIIEKNGTRLNPGEPVHASYYTVRRGDRYEDRLTSGEALEVAARWLFSPAEAGLPYLKSPEAQVAERKKFGHYDDDGLYVEPQPEQTPAEAGTEK